MRAIIAPAAGVIAISGCATASSNRYRTLQEDWQRSDHRAERPHAAGDLLFEGASSARRARSCPAAFSSATPPCTRRAMPGGLRSLAIRRSPRSTTRGSATASARARSDRTRWTPRTTSHLSQAIPLPGKALAARRARTRGGRVGAERRRDGAGEARCARVAPVRRVLARRSRARDQRPARNTARRGAPHAALSRYAAGTGSQQDVLARRDRTGNALAPRAGTRRRAPRRSRTHRFCCCIAPRSASSHRLRTSSSLRSRPRARRAGARREGVRDPPRAAGVGGRIRAREAEVALARREFFPASRCAAATRRRGRWLTSCPWSAWS